MLGLFLPGPGSCRRIVFHLGIQVLFLPKFVLIGFDLPGFVLPGLFLPGLVLPGFYLVHSWMSVDGSSGLLLELGEVV
jgi:hypothetical protein